MRLIKKLLLPIAAAISLSACNNLKSVDFQTFKEEVKKVDISNRQEYTSVIVDGTMKMDDTKFSWDHKELSQDDGLGLTLADFAVFMMIDFDTLDLIIDSVQDKLDNKYYIGDSFKMYIKESNVTEIWNKDLMLTKIDGVYEGSVCHLSFQYKYSQK